MKDQYIYKKNISQDHVIKVKKGKITLGKIKKMIGSTCRLVSIGVPIVGGLSYYPVKFVYPELTVSNEIFCLEFLIYVMAIVGSKYLYEESDDLYQKRK